MKNQERCGEWGVGAILFAACVGTLASAQVRGGTPGGGGNLQNDIRERPIPGTSWDATRIEGMPRRARGSGSLAHDVVVSSGPRPAGAVLDGGTIYVELQDDVELELSFEVTILGGPDPLRAKPKSREKRTLRLAGGEVGDAGVIFLSTSAPRDGKNGLRAMDSAAIAGFFGEDGSFVVELPQEPEEAAGPLYAQGANLSSRIRSEVVSLGVGESEPSWEANGISSAVHRALRDQGSAEGVRLRFYGGASLGDLRRIGDVSVVLSQLEARFMLHDLASDSVLSFSSEAALAGAVEALFYLDAFSGIEIELDQARASLGSRCERLVRCGFPGLTGKQQRQLASAPTKLVERGVELGSDASAEVGAELGEVTAIESPLHGIRPPRPGPAHGQLASAPTKSVERGVELGSEASAEVGAAIGEVTAIESPSHRIQPPRSEPSQATRFDGTIHDGGTVEVDMSIEPLAPSWSVNGVSPIAEQPHRAEKAPEAAAPVAKRFAGEIGDAGSREVVIEAQQEVDHARRALEDLQFASRSLARLRTKLQRGSY